MVVFWWIARFVKVESDDKLAQSFLFFWVEVGYG